MCRSWYFSHKQTKTSLSVQTKKLTVIIIINKEEIASHRESFSALSFSSPSLICFTESRSMLTRQRAVWCTMWEVLPCLLLPVFVTVWMVELSTKRAPFSFLAFPPLQSVTLNLSSEVDILILPDIDEDLSSSCLVSPGPASTGLIGLSSLCWWRWKMRWSPAYYYILFALPPILLRIWLFVAQASNFDSVQQSAFPAPPSR